MFKSYYIIFLFFVVLFLVGAGCGNEDTQDVSNNEEVTVSESSEGFNDSEKEVVVDFNIISDAESITDENLSEEDVVIPPQVRQFDMVAKQWAFEPAMIEVNEGDTIHLNITSVDVAHGFYLKEFEVDKRLEPNQTVNIEFIADKKGTYTFVCNVFCGSGHGKMKGTLLVK